MDGPRDYHANLISQIKKDKSYDIIFTWNVKYNTNFSMKQTQTLRHREQTCGCQEGEEVGTGGLGSANTSCYM